jgi:hypothetical protein
MTESTSPALKVKGQMESIPAHMAEHARLRRERMNWIKNKTLGSIRIMNEVTIDDRRIAIETNRNLFELKSFGQTMDISLDKPRMLAQKEAMEHMFIEERINFRGDTHYVEVKSNHITVWEYNPRSSQKWRIA